MRYVQIRNNKIALIRELEKKPPVGVWIKIQKDQEINIGDSFINGEIVPVPVNLFLHIETNRSPSNVINDNQDILIVTATLRQSTELDSTVISNFPDKEWYIPVRDSKNNIYSIETFSFKNGIGTLNFKTKKQPEICQISQQDIIPVTFDNTTYNIQLFGKLKFLVRNK